jgi:hypothetical protein
LTGTLAFDSGLDLIYIVGSTSDGSGWPGGASGGAGDGCGVTQRRAAASSPEFAQTAVRGLFQLGFWPWSESARRGTRVGAREGLRRPERGAPRRLAAETHRRMIAAARGRERGDKRRRDTAHPVVELQGRSGVEWRWRSGCSSSSPSSSGALMAAALGFAREGGASSKGYKAGSAAP